MNADDGDRLVQVENATQDANNAILNAHNVGDAHNTEQTNAMRESPIF